eukprot:11220611-Lingulodinium_polyedra.AAC.1
MGHPRRPRNPTTRLLMAMSANVWAKTGATTADHPPPPRAHAAPAALWSFLPERRKMLGALGQGRPRFP